MAEISSLIGKKGWGKVDQNGKITVWKKESEEMEGQPAEDYAAIADYYRGFKYGGLADKVEKLLKGTKQPLIADLGSGPGVLDEMIAKKIPDAEIVGIDLSAKMVNIAKEGARKAGLSARVSFVKIDALKAPEYFESRGRKPDMVISKDVLHRVDNVAETLLAFTQTVKENGGIVCAVSFLSLEDFDLRGLQQFAKGIRERENIGESQKSWTLARLNAPTIKKYQEALDFVTRQVKTQKAALTPDALYNANILIERSI